MMTAFRCLQVKGGHSPGRIPHDALGAHARDELGITETLSARPLQAALASVCSFAGGAALPLLVTALVPAAQLILVVSGASLACLALLGGVAARVGGARATGAHRVDTPAHGMPPLASRT